MKLKKEYIILVVIIIALVLYLALNSGNDNDSNLPRPDKIEAAKINRIVISKADKTTELDKKDETWFIEPSGFKADKAKATNMVNALADIQLSALVSESGNYQRYGLAPDERISVKAYSGGKEVRSMDIGKAAPTYQHTFVKLAGDPKVYHAMGQINSTFDQSIEALRDKTIFDVDKKNIKTITFKKGDQTLALTRKEVPVEKPEPPAVESKDEKENAGAETETKAESQSENPPPEIQWQNEEGQAMDKGTVDRLISGIAKLSCDGFVQEGEEEKLQNPEWTVTFNDGQKDYTLSVYANDDEKATQMTATASTVDYAFVLKKYRVDRFEKAIKTLLGTGEEQNQQ